MMIQRHDSDETDPHERGAAFGEAQRAAVLNTVAFYQRLFADSAGLSGSEVEGYGRRIRAEIGRRHPDLVAEIEGIAAGAGVPPDLLTAVNARTELLALGDFSGPRRRGAAECSHIGVLPEMCADHRTYLAQTWDFHPDLIASRVVWTLPARSGGRLATFTEAGVLAKIGINSSRVVLLLAFLATDLDGAAGGLPVHLLARRILDSSANAASGLRMISENAVSAAVAFTLGYAEGPGDGFLAGVAMAPDGWTLRVPDAAGILVQTNHFVERRADDLALRPDGWHGTVVRYDFLSRRLRRAIGRVDRAYIDELLNSRFGAPDSVCVQSGVEPNAWERQLRTLATAVFDPAARTMTVTGGAVDTSSMVVTLDQASKDGR